MRAISACTVRPMQSARQLTLYASLRAAQPLSPLGPPQSQPPQAHSPCRQHEAHLRLLLLQVDDERLHEDGHRDCPGRGPDVSDALDEPMLDVLQGVNVLGAGKHLQGERLKVRLSSSDPVRD